MSKPIFKTEEKNVSYSLKNIFNKVEEEKTEAETNQNLPQEPFAEEQLLKLWQAFLEQLKIENKIPSYNALLTAKVKLLDNFQIEFVFSSLSTSEEFTAKKERLILELRQKLNNHSIEFVTRIDNSQTKSYIQTKPEIFMEMAKKNPLLLKLKNEFGLDLNSND